MSKSNVGLDSQCYTYLIDTLATLNEPTGNLIEQKLALFRIFSYSENGLCISPTLQLEYRRIRNTARAELHEEWTTLFGEIQPIDISRIDNRVKDLLKTHNDPDDCRILAEAEDAGLSVLLSYDSNLINRLGRASSVSIQQPLEYWSSLNIAKGAKPKTAPRHDNPMTNQTWWRWI